MNNGVTPQRFIAKWEAAALTERAASQEHFIDLCRLLGQPTPAERDASGSEYTFEKGVSLTAPASRGAKGQHGFADVWWRGKFAWEYKRKDKYQSLDEAYRQLCQYRESLENPPLLIVSDITRIEIHTNFTATRKEIHRIELRDIAHPDNLARLRRVFVDPLSFKPTLSTYHLTENAAAEFAKIADQLRQRKHDPHAAAHFLMKCMFCLFAEDVRLLPDGIFTKLLQRGVKEPEKLPARLDLLFAAMRDGGDFGTDVIAHFNGGLFDDAPSLALTATDIQAMLVAAQFDWGAVEPSIFGTLFERSLDPSKRSQIGAHYTSREDVMLIVEPVVMAPLRQQWRTVQDQVDQQLARRRKVATAATKRKADTSIAKAIEGFLDHLAGLRILDPACGSGNFLYVAIQELLTLEKEVIVYASQPHIGLALLPRVRPTQLHGLELNPYAAELAQVVVWIGYLQWLRDNGFLDPTPPILDPLQTIACRDAILKWQDDRAQALTEWRPGAKCCGTADWPVADFIIGNPPFLGSKLFRQYGLDETYIEALYASFDLPKTSDLCCYWFELARRAVTADHTPQAFGAHPPRAAGFSPRGTPARNECRTSESTTRHATRGAVRAGLLATQGIRGGDNRTVLERIKNDGDIFMAWSDRDWVLDGANVHVSMVGFDDATEHNRMLDGAAVARINADLTTSADLTHASRLKENLRVAFVGACKKGRFELSWEQARTMLSGAGNPHGRPNVNVLAPWINGIDVVRRYCGDWIIDFGTEEDLATACQYELPMEYVRSNVKPERDRVRASAERRRWWMLARPAPECRKAVVGLERFIGVPQVAKHRLFAWLHRPAQPSHQLTLVARADDYFFGVLHSSIHELWSLRMGTQLEDRPRYTPTTCFETFPLPWPPGSEPRASARAELPPDMNVAVPSAPRDITVAAPDNARGPASGTAYLLTWTTYGTWLPGDERGFVGRVPNGVTGHTIHNAPGEPYDINDARLHAAARARMKGAPVTLDERAAAVCRDAFLETADRHAVGIHAGAIMSTHVHLVVSAHDAHGTDLLRLFKGVAARRLGQVFPSRAPTSCWTRGGSHRMLASTRALREATRYVREQPGALAVFDHAPQAASEPRASARAELPPDVNVAASSGPSDTHSAAQLHARISDAAQELNEQRERWLNPPEWIEDWGRAIDARDKFDDVARISGEEARRLIRHSAIMAEAAQDPRFRRRTLTCLYNERPTWLRLAHEALDRAVLAAYAAVDPAGEWSEDWAQVWVETGAGQPLPDAHPQAARRNAIDQQVLTNLLRLNHARATQE